MVKDLWFLKDACNNSHSWVIYICRKQKNDGWSLWSTFTVNKIGNLDSGPAMFEQNSANCKELTLTASVPFYSSTLAINLDLIHSKTAYYIRKKVQRDFKTIGGYIWKKFCWMYEKILCNP